MTPPLKVYHSASGLVAENDGQCRVLPASIDFDRLFSAAEPDQILWAAYAAGREVARPETVLAPIGRQAPIAAKNAIVCREYKRPQLCIEQPPCFLVRTFAFQAF